MQSAETDEVTWMSDKMFLSLKTLRPDKHNQLFGINTLNVAQSCFLHLMAREEKLFV